MPNATSLPKQKIIPFLWFDSNAEEATAFYASIFKDSRLLGVTRYGEGGGKPVRRGRLKDRLGLSCQIVPATLPELLNEPAKGDRAMSAVPQMVKLDIARLKAAAEGR